MLIDVNIYDRSALAERKDNKRFCQQAKARP